MRDHRQGRLGISLREDHALAGHAIEVRCNFCFRAEKAHAIGAGGIERDEDDIRLGGGSRRHWVPDDQSSEQECRENPPEHDNQSTAGSRSCMHAGESPAATRPT